MWGAFIRNASDLPVLAWPARRAHAAGLAGNALGLVGPSGDDGQDCEVLERDLLWPFVFVVCGDVPDSGEGALGDIGLPRTMDPFKANCRPNCPLCC